ncbi:Reticulon-like protein B5 [Sesamum angolense]|uniref:Reticulon-like protein n=1 Tax=Sesamum angolense TaxID=2727404 RepID=A0AAE1XA14_9LAMI|nr:Reticulon-like protein B5 [Sesamum angolense]
MSGDPDLFEPSEEKVHNEETEEEKFHLFGRQKPVHSALGGGKPADVILWRNKQISAALLAGATVIWLLFERIGYHLITFICHCLILSLATLFLWSNLSFFVNKAPYNFPEIVLPEDLCMSAARLLTDRFNKAFAIFRAVAVGKDLKRLLYYFVMILTMPLLYEKHEDQVDSYALKAKSKLQKQYSKLDEKVLQKLPKVPLGADNKQQ